MPRKSWFGILVLAGLVLVFIGFFGVALRLEGGKKAGLSDLTDGEGVGVLPLDGVIMDSKKFVEQLIAFRDNDSVKAIVIRADSPGGAVGPSQEIYSEIKKVNAKKPVIVSIGALCASGCYYAAVGTRRIFTNPGSLVGSIGVIMPLYEAKGLFDWAMIHPQFIKSGPMKDLGHPAKPLTPEEAAALQSVVDDTYAQFVSAVTQGRTFAGMNTDAVRQVSDGRVFTGKQAKALGLVDELGTLRDAVAYAGTLAKLTGEPKMIYPAESKKKLIEYLMDETLGSVRESLAKGVNEMLLQQTTPASYFLWKP
jgi:protease-4